MMRGDASLPDIDPAALIRAAVDEDAVPLLFERLLRSPDLDEYFSGARDDLAAAAREAACEELARGAETRAFLDALASAGVRAVLIKGTPLAYTVYPSPACRPRQDTDLFVAAADVDKARRLAVDRGYALVRQCSDLFSQFEVQRVDQCGVVHAFDLHWKVSAQPAFAAMLAYEEVCARSARIPALGEHARAAGLVDALLLACTHSVMHHRNQERLLWMFDIHLLVRHASTSELAEFVDLARKRRIAAVCAHSLRRAQTVFRTPHALELASELTATANIERSAAYLEPNRQWRHEALSSFLDLTSWAQRIEFVRRVLIPSRQYMLDAYGLEGKPLATLLLPALYLHRSVRGAWHVLAGQK
jgi:hypothetical protein